MHIYLNIGSVCLMCSRIMKIKGVLVLLLPEKANAYDPTVLVLRGVIWILLLNGWKRNLPEFFQFSNSLNIYSNFAECFYFHSPRGWIAHSRRPWLCPCLHFRFTRGNKKNLRIKSTYHHPNHASSIQRPVSNNRFLPVQFGLVWSCFYQLFGLGVFCCVLFIRNWEFERSPWFFSNR